MGIKRKHCLLSSHTICYYLLLKYRYYDYRKMLK